MKKCLFLFFLLIAKAVFAIDIIDDNKYYLNFNSNLSYFLTVKQEEFFIPYLVSFDSMFEYISDKNTVGFYNSFELNNRQKQKRFIKGTYLYNYLYNENDYGRVEVGEAKNILSKIHIFSPVFVFNNNIKELSLFLFDNSKYTFNTDIITDDKLLKINYITPKFNGFQFASFYLPDLKNDKIKNGGGVGMKYFYSSSFDLTSTFSFAEFNDINNYGIKANKVKEYSVGTILYKQGIQFSTAFKLQMEKEKIIKRNFDIGVSYEIGGLLVGLGHYMSYFSKDDFKNLTILSSKYKFNNIIDFATGFGVLYSQPKDKISPVLFLGIGAKF